MAIPPIILERVETFRRNIESYIDPEYKETRLRREFIDPFFAALGWDVQNKEGYAEAYKDVVHEDTLKISGVGTTAPDYSFRIGGTRKFFVEAKKPAVRIGEDPEPAAQLRRYSWSAKLQLGIVTDFQEFAIYDTRIRPREADKATTARIFYCTFDQYPEKWDEIAGILSRVAVLRGSFDRYAAGAKGKRGTAAFDDAFLEDLEVWRKHLAENLALRNRSLTQRQLNFAVQRTLDRIIFLRIAEDRGIEKYGQLLALTAGSRIYPRLCDVFRLADSRYNSGLFQFEVEKDREESPDRLTLDLDLDDTVLKEIIGALYYPKCPYAFAVIPADILGQVYEQFLGKVIHLTDGHHARIERKPELQVRKAGGVYYTPTYIVDYIVRQTIGPLVEGRTPKEVEKLRILDPACGSGSFLLGAYEFLLSWHLRYYLVNDPAAWAKKKLPPIYETAPNAFGLGQGSGNWQLTGSERRRILLNNIFGVDIDAQAVEVTKLSLLLKVLEGEARELQGRQLDFHRVLPDLGKNIKCGNSLIGSDFYQQLALPDLDDEARLKINAFDWKVEFAAVIRAGGFDAVIGNPPYIFTRGLISESEREYFRQYYPLAEDKHNTFVLFMEKLLSLTRYSGRSGLIVPNSWLTVESCSALRRAFLNVLVHIADLNFQVWPKVSLEPCIFVIEKGVRTPLISTKRVTDQDGLTAARASTLTRTDAPAPQYRLAFSENKVFGAVIEKAAANTVPLSTNYDVRTGLQAYERGKGNPPQTAVDVANHVFDQKVRADRTCHRYLEGRDVARYHLNWSRMWMSWGPWLSQPRELAIFQRPRLLIREITARPPYRICAVFTQEDFLSNKSVVTVLRADDSVAELKYLLGIVNSRILSAYYAERAVKGARKIFPKIVINNLREFPLPRSAEREVHNEIIIRVERMLKLHQELAAAKTPDDQTRLQREIAATDCSVDNLVCQLYGLTAAEIAIVEQETAVPVAEEQEAIEATSAPLPPEAYAQAEADAAHFHYIKEDPANT